MLEGRGGEVCLGTVRRRGEVFGDGGWVVLKVEG